MTRPLIAVSIVTYNSAGVIAACLRSLPDDIILYVTDNKSSDDTVAVVRRERPDAIITVPRRNLGFGRAHNVNFRIILKQTPADFVLVLNPDTELQASCLEHLLNAAKLPAAGMIGALHEQSDGSINSCFRNDFDYYPQLVRRLKYWNAKGPAAKAVPQDSICVEQITGALMLIRRDALQIVKGFDSKLFMYFEDDDLCARMRHAGYNVILSPQARVFHYEGQSSGGSLKVQCIKGYHFERSRKIVHATYHGRGIGYYMLIVTGLLRCLRRALKFKLRGNHLRSHYYMAGCYGLLSAA